MQPTVPRPALPARRTGLMALTVVLLMLVSCQQADGQAAAAAPTALRVVTVTSGLSHPWGLAFLPNGDMLVTEREGRLRRISADGRTVSAPLRGVPAVMAQGQGGLLDVQVDPEFGKTPWVYLSYAEAGQGAEAGLAGTAVARGKLGPDGLSEVQVIFRQTPKVAGTGHFGARLVFARDQTLFITLGERQQDSPAQPNGRHAQALDNTLGKVVRITKEGGIPTDNPRFAGRASVPGLWSLGHRNPQGAALDPRTGELWLTEHGPQGGDELNHVRPGANHGWPWVSYGCPYGSKPGPDCQTGGGRHAPRFVEPVSTWVPVSVAPSGLAFNTGPRYPGWEGQLFMGALAGQALWRIALQGDQVVAREALLTQRAGRIRDVRLGPDGWLYLLTDEDAGRIVRIER